MKIHKGAVLDSLYRHVTGNVLGGGMSADEIVSVISTYGYLFDSAAPTAVPNDVSRSENSGGPFGNAHTFTFAPVAMGFPNQANTYIALVTFNIIASNGASTNPGQYPPVLKIGVSVGGCVAPGTPNESYVAYASQSNPGSGGEEDVHRNYSFTILCEIESCGAGGADFTLTMDDFGGWASWGDITWSVVANAIIVIEE